MTLITRTPLDNHETHIYDTATSYLADILRSSTSKVDKGDHLCTVQGQTQDSDTLLYSAAMTPVPDNAAEQTTNPVPTFGHGVGIHLAPPPGQRPPSPEQLQAVLDILLRSLK